jgi:hypothetical protein
MSARNTCFHSEGLRDGRTWGEWLQLKLPADLIATMEYIAG